MSGQAEKGRNGVAVMCDRASANAIMGYDTVSDRILSVRFRGSITIIQVYAPTSTASEEEQDNFFIKLQSTIDRTPKGDVTIRVRPKLGFGYGFGAETAKFLGFGLVSVTAVTRNLFSA